MGRGEFRNSKSVAEPWSKTVRVGDEEFDVSGFRHPGGSVMDYYLANSGADATEAWKEFHSRSKRAQNLLKNWPKELRRPAQFEIQADKDAKLNAAFANFRKELEEEGFFDPSPLHIAWRMTELCLIFVLGCYLWSQGWVILGSLVHGMFGCRSGWVQHEGGHNSLTGYMKLDKLIQKACIGFGLGASGGMWNSMHQKHHATPQKEAHDLDLDTTPFVAFFPTAFEVNRKRFRLPLWWTRFQAYLFLPITSGVFIMIFWLLFLHPRKVLSDKDWIQGAFMLSGHIVRTWVFMQCTGWTSIVASYLVGYWLCMWVSGMLLFGHFSTSHTFLDTVDKDEHKSWVRYAVEHTVDITPDNKLVSWIMGFLNCQVIHHLFPSMPQFRQPEASRRFAEFAKENGLDYKIISYREAWSNTFGNMDKVGKELAHAHST